jgi:hypothetical protein
LKSTANSNEKKRKHDELFEDKIQKRCITFCRLRGKIYTSHFKGIYKNRCKNNYNDYWPKKEMIWSCTTLVDIIVVAHP